MHFLVETVENKFPKVLGFLDELRDSEEACKGKICSVDFIYERSSLNLPCAYILVNKIEITSSFASIKKGLKQFDVLSSDDAFTCTMREFQKEAKIKFDQVDKLQSESEASFEKAVSFYGENVQKTQLNEFFNIFCVFINSWQVK